MTRPAVSSRAASGIVAETPVVFHDCSAITYGGNVTAAKALQSGATLADVTASTLNGNACLNWGPLTDTVGISSVTFTATTPVPINNRRTMSFLIYCTDFLTLLSLTSIQIQFETGDFTNYLSASHPITQQIDGNWHLVTAHFSDNTDFISGYTMTKAGTASTVCTYIRAGNVKRVMLRAATGAGIPDFKIGGIWFGGRVAIPKIIVGYDGAYISQKNVALASHSAYGFPGTLYVTKHKLGTNTYFLTDSDLDTFYAAGWAIAQHSYSNTNGWDSYASTQAVVDEIGLFQTWAASRGFRRGLGHACWPYVAPGSFSAANRTKVFDAIRQSGLLKTIRNGASAGASGCLNANNLAISPIHRPFAPRQLWSPQGQTNGSTVTGQQAFDRFIRPTICAGHHAHLYAHEVTTSGGAGGGDGLSTPAGSNYWLKSEYDIFMARISSYIQAGMCEGGTIAEYD